MSDKDNKGNDDVYKILNKIYKLQDNQQKSRGEEYAILEKQLSQMNILLSKLISSTSTNINVAEGQKSIPFDTGPVTVSTVNLTKPTNPDNYPVAGTVNVYALNNSTPMQHMTLINDGPGDLHFIAAHSRNEFNTAEGLLHPNDQRELFNVYEVRLRVTLPLTSYRLMEGVFRTGSFAPATKANVEIRPTIQANEVIKTFVAQFEIASPTLTVNSPIPVIFNLLNINPAIQNPLPPGQTAAFIDNVTGFPMPFTIPEGFILESFLITDNMSTDNTVSTFLEFVPGTLTSVASFPISNRGAILNLQLNLSGVASTQVVDPFGAPVGGRDILFVITNDDPFNNMIGSIIFVAILRRLT